MNISRNNILKISNVLYITALLFIAYKLSYNISNYWDIMAAAELTYLKYGKNLFNEVHFDWGFLYNVWYKFLSLFQPSTVDLYYFNYKVLITLVPLLLFICLLFYNINSTIAFTISFLFLISKLHVTTWPFVSDFCILLILLYFILIKFIKDDGWKLILLSLFSLLLYLARPECIMTFVAAVCISFYINRNHKKKMVDINSNGFYFNILEEKQLL